MTKTCHRESVTDLDNALVSLFDSVVFYHRKLKHPALNPSRSPSLGINSLTLRMPYTYPSVIYMKVYIILDHGLKIVVTILVKYTHIHVHTNHD